MQSLADIPVRGKLTPDYDLSKLTWLKVGGPAAWLFLPADTDDLSAFTTSNVRRRHLFDWCKDT